MSRKVFFGQNDIRYFYNRYKDSKYYSASVFFLVIAACSILLVIVIIPQFNNYLSIRQEVAAKQDQIRIMNENIAFINRMDKSTITSQLKSATQALPAEKDFAGILNAIADASIRSGVSVSDFSFSVGDISSRSAINTSNPVPVGNSSPGSVASLGNIAPSVNLMLTIDGNIDSVKLFIKEISEKLPLSDVTTIDNKDNKTTVSIEFYYKPYPEIAFKEDSPMQPISPEKVKLIERIALWKNSISEEIVSPIATNSSIPLFD